MGIGNEERGDDGVGVELARRLAARGWKGALVAGMIPENASREIAAVSPRTVIAVDAVDMGLPAGSWRVLENEEIASASFSTHGFSLALLLRYWKESSLSRVVVLGVQPSSRAAGRGFSPEVAKTLDLLERLFSCHDRLPSNLMDHASGTLPSGPL